MTVLDHVSCVTDRTAQNHAEYHAKDLEEKGCDLGIYLQHSYKIVCISEQSEGYNCRAAGGCFHLQTPRHQTVHIKEISLILKAKILSLFFVLKVNAGRTAPNINVININFTVTIAVMPGIASKGSEFQNA